MPVPPPIRRISERLSAVVQTIPPKRAGAAAAALLLTLGTVWIPASRIRPPVNEGEGWGEIHWYHAEKAPAEAGAFRECGGVPLTPQ